MPSEHIVMCSKREFVFYRGFVGTSHSVSATCSVSLLLAKTN
jgi:hypothetical protein